MRYGSLVRIVLALLVMVTGALAQSVTVQNQWHGGFLSARPNAGPVMVGRPGADAGWIVESVAGTRFVRLRAADGLGYLNLQSGNLAIGDVAPGEPQALWTLVQNPDGSFKLASNLGPGLFLNTQTGHPSVSTVQPGWASANWMLQPIAGAAGTAPVAQQPQVPAGGGQAAGTASAAVQAGDVVVTISNGGFPEMDVVQIDQQNHQTLLAQVQQGQTVNQSVPPGIQLGFAANRQWVGHPYTVASQPRQSVAFDARGAMTSSPPAASTTAQAPSATTTAPSTLPGAVWATPPVSGSPVVVTILNRAYPEIDVVHIDAQNQQALLVKVPMGQTLARPVDPGSRLGFAVNGQWVGQPYPVTGKSRQSVVFSASGMIADGVAVPGTAPAATAAASGGAIALPPAGAANGSVAVAITNQSYPEVDVVNIDPQGKQTLLAQVTQGKSVAQLLAPGTKLGFASGGQWVGQPYVVTSVRKQSVGFTAQGMVTSGPPAGQPASQTASTGAGSAASTGLVQITITNSAYPDLRVIHYDAQNNPSLFAEVAQGKSITQPASPNGALGFQVGNSLLTASPYAITTRSTQTISFDAKGATANGVALALAAPVAPAAPAGSVAVAVTNSTAASIRVTEMDSPPKGLADIAAHASQTVNVMPGAVLAAFDTSINDFVGGNYTVVSGQSQRVTIPYQPPGTVAVTLHNTTGSDLVCDSMADASSDQSTYLTTVPANQSRIRYLTPGLNLAFANATANPDGSTSWNGMPYTVTADARQTVNLPVALSQTQLDAIVQQVAANVVQQMQQQEAQSPVCWKASHGRGVGTIPTICDGGAPDSQAGLCYSGCPAGYTGAVTMCVPICPPGYRDDGLYCYKPEAQNRFFPESAGEFFNGTGLDGARARCAASLMGSQAGCTSNGVAIYANCANGYTNFGDVCSPSCPSNTTDIGISCQKNTIDRGVGQIPNCGGSTPDKDAGLCYKGCSPGENGVGPVCWGSCPTGWTDCGAMCGKDTGSCATAITNEVTSTGMAVANVGLIAVTAGAAAGATPAIEAGEATAEEGAKIAAKEGAEEAGKAGLKASIRQQLVAGMAAAGKDVLIQTAIGSVIGTGTAAYATITKNEALHKQIVDTVKQALANNVTDAELDTAVNAAVQKADENSSIGDNFDYSSLDPTGIASVVMSFVIPMCPDIKVQ